MKFLIDNSASPMISQALQEAGHDSLHVRDIGMRDASDEDIMDKARQDDRVVVTLDADFGMLHALHLSTKPSIIWFRKDFNKNPMQQLQYILANLPSFKYYLEEGSIITYDGRRTRIRSLPIFDYSENQ